MNSFGNMYEFFIDGALKVNETHKNQKLQTMTLERKSSTKFITISNKNKGTQIEFIKSDNKDVYDKINVTFPNGYKIRAANADTNASTMILPNIFKPTTPTKTSTPTPTPTAPTEPGCYVYSNDTCPKQKFNTQGKWYRDVWGEKNRKANETKENCAGRAKEYDKWCGSNDFIYQFNPKPSTKPEPKQKSEIKTTPPAPTTSGCYVYSNDTCPKQKGFNTQGRWFQDTWGERNAKAGESKENCAARAKEFDKWCGSTDYISHFNPK